jgi:uncharacterized protein YndB with AHSA1/START domain
MSQGMASARMSSTRISRHIKAPASRIFGALVSGSEISKWRFPEGMTIEVHEFDGCEGGRFRVSLTYSATSHAGKTTAHTDTYHGYFKELVPDRRVVEVIEFETADPAMRGRMTLTVELFEADGSTQLTALHEGLPPSVSPSDNETGWSMALEKLAKLVEVN